MQCSGGKIEPRKSTDIAKGVGPSMVSASTGAGNTGRGPKAFRVPLTYRRASVIEVVGFYIYIYIYIVF